MTFFPVTALRSVDLETPDIGRSERFYTEVWGLDLVTRICARLGWRIDLASAPGAGARFTLHLA